MTAAIETSATPDEDVPVKQVTAGEVKPYGDGGQDTPANGAKDTPAEGGKQANSVDQAPTDKSEEESATPRGHLALDPQQSRLTPEQRAALPAIGITDDFDTAQVRRFFHFCQVRGIDPWLGQAHLIRHKGKNGKPDNYAIVTSIDTYRLKAHATGRYRGTVAVLWTGPDDDPNSWYVEEDTGIRRRVWQDVWLDTKNPAAAKVVIEYYDGRGQITREEGIANWAMFAVLVYRDGKWEPNSMWKKGGPHMLAKCAEALALRRAFPADLGGMYVQEEMDHLRADAAAEYMANVEQKRREARKRAAAMQEAKLDPRDTLEGVIVGQPAEQAPDLPEMEGERELLMGELAQQARIVGTSQTQMLDRLVLMHRCEPERLPIEALRQLVLDMRPSVASEMEKRGAAAAADMYRQMPGHGHPAIEQLLAQVAGPGSEPQAG